MLELKSVSVNYGLSQILENVNLMVSKAGIVTLLGRNGMGENHYTENYHGPDQGV